jgi:uncharacterized membrane protein
MHTPHLHHPTNINTTQAQELTGINARIAVILTRRVGSMPTAYSFVVLACIGLLAILGVLSPIVAVLIAWLSQTFIQLVLLPVIMVGQNVLNRKTELQADEEYERTRKIYADAETIIKQNNEIIALLSRGGSK